MMYLPMVADSEKSITIQQTESANLEILWFCFLIGNGERDILTREVIS